MMRFTKLILCFTFALGVFAGGASAQLEEELKATGRALNKEIKTLEAETEQKRLELLEAYVAKMSTYLTKHKSDSKHKLAREVQIEITRTLMQKKIPDRHFAPARGSYKRSRDTLNTELKKLYSTLLQARFELVSQEIETWSKKGKTLHTQGDKAEASKVARALRSWKNHQVIREHKAWEQRVAQAAQVKKTQVARQPKPSTRHRVDFSDYPWVTAIYPAGKQPFRREARRLSVNYTSQLSRSISGGFAATVMEVNPRSQSYKTKHSESYSYTDYGSDGPVNKTKTKRWSEQHTYKRVIPRLSIEGTGNKTYSGVKVLFEHYSENRLKGLNPRREVIEVGDLDPSKKLIIDGAGHLTYHFKSSKKGVDDKRATFFEKGHLISEKPAGKNLFVGTVISVFDGTGKLLFQRSSSSRLTPLAPTSLP